MILSVQIRAARALLGISQDELARLSGVGSATIKRLELGTSKPRGNVQTIVRLREALEAAGVVFIDHDEKLGPGVRLKSRID